MKMATLALLTGLLATSSALADTTRCSTDSYGNTTCRGDDGSVTRSSTDSYGNTTTRSD